MNFQAVFNRTLVLCLIVKSKCSLRESPVALKYGLETILAPSS